MPRFAILTHDWPALHWDLLLEDGLEAETWRLLQEPGIQGVQASPSPRHRLHYLNYEGPVSNNRGTVTQWDTGTFEWRVRSDTQIEFILDGDRLKGVWQFALTSGEPVGQVCTSGPQLLATDPHQKTQTTSSLPDQTRQASQTEQVWWFSAAEAAQLDTAEASQAKM